MEYFFVQSFNENGLLRMSVLTQINCNFVVPFLSRIFQRSLSIVLKIFHNAPRDLGVVSVLAACAKRKRCLTNNVSSGRGGSQSACRGGNYVKFDSGAMASVSYHDQRYLVLEEVVCVLSTRWLAAARFGALMLADVIGQRWGSLTFSLSLSLYV